MTESRLPVKLKQLVKAFKTELGAEVEVERVESPDPWPDRFRFRLAVVSPKFKEMNHLRRQELVWKIVNRILEPGEQLSILSIILAFSPNELEPAGKQKR
jgi:stress-induced morphogen